MNRMSQARNIIPRKPLSSGGIRSFVGMKAKVFDFTDQTLHECEVIKKQGYRLRVRLDSGKEFSIPSNKLRINV